MFVLYHMLASSWVDAKTNKYYYIKDKLWIRFPSKIYLEKLSYIPKKSNWTTIKPGDVYPEDLQSSATQAQQSGAHPTSNSESGFTTARSCHKDGLEDPDLERWGVLRKSL